MTLELTLYCKKVKCNGPTDGQTDGPTDGPTKQGVESCARDHSSKFFIFYSSFVRLWFPRDMIYG